MRVLTQPFHDYAKGTREGVRTRDGHLLVEFERDPRVCSISVLNRPLSMAEALLRSRRDFEWACVFSRCDVRQDQKSPKLGVIQTSVPHVVRPILERRDFWTTSFNLPSVKRELREHIAATDVLLLSNPMAYPLLDLVGHDTMVALDAIDDWSNHPQMSDKRGYIAEGYKTILRRADVVVTNATKMKDQLIARGARDVEIVPNGIKAAWLDQPIWRPPTGPVRIGYAGKLAKRIDVELIASLADRHPNWTIELVGPVLDAGWLKPLRLRSNVLFVGEMAHEDLPDRFRLWHAALIPHNVGTLENGGHPIKLYEYLSIGLPVISTGIAELKDVEAHIDIATSHQHFEDAVIAAITDTEHTVKATRRRDAVRACTWQSSASEFVDLLQRARS